MCWSVHRSAGRLVGPFFDQSIDRSLIFFGDHGWFFKHCLAPNIWLPCLFLHRSRPPPARDMGSCPPPPHAVWEAVYPAFFQVKLNVRKSLNGMERLSEQPSLSFFFNFKVSFSFFFASCLSLEFALFFISRYFSVFFSDW